MVVWKVTCHWFQENDYSRYDREPTEIGIFTSRPLAALAALDFIKSMNRKCRRRYVRVVSALWNDCIEISEYGLYEDCSYGFADIYFTQVTLNSGLTY